MSLNIPEIPGGADNLTAGLLWAKAGWYVLPVNPRDKKNPGSRVGKAWQTKSSRDPEQIAAWFAGTDDLLALHVGRSGAVVFDVDEVNKLPEALSFLPNSDGPYQSTRADETGRGHYPFLMPHGRSLGNSKTGLPGGWGEVRGKNGVIIVEPSEHEKAATGGRYAWLRRGIVPALPEALAVVMADAQDAADAATDAEVAAFLAAHTAETRPVLLRGKVKAWTAKLDAGESRHETACGFVAGALKEARAGYYRASTVVEEMGALFWERTTTSRPGDPGSIQRTDRQASDEWAGIMSWAVAQANAANIDEVRRQVEERVPERTVDPFGDPFSAPTTQGGAPEPAGDAGAGSEQAPQGAVAASPPVGGTWREVPLEAVVAGLLNGSIERLTPTVGKLDGGGALFYAGKVNGIAGASGSGKSWTALVSCAQEIREGRHAVYVDLEDDKEGVTGRLLDMGADPNDVLSRFHYVRPDEKYTLAAQHELVALITSYEPVSLVVIDSTGEAMALDGYKPNDDDDTAMWFRRLPGAVARLGPAVIVLDHVVKTDDGGLWPIGSQRKRAAISGAQYMQITVRAFAKEEAGSGKLTCAKDRHGAYRTTQRVAEIVVTPAGGGRVEIALNALAETSGQEAGGFRPTTLMERVSQYLQAANEPRSRNVIGDEVRGKRVDVLLALDILKREEHVAATQGRRAELCTLVRPYRQVDDPASDKYIGARERLEPADPFADASEPSPSRSFLKEKERGTGQDRSSNPFPGTGEERVGNGSAQADAKQSEPTRTSLEAGPCAACLKPTRKYGPNGHKLCQSCRSQSGQEAGA